MNSELRAAILGLLLPCDQSEEERFLDFFLARLEALDIDEEDRSLWVRAQLGFWQANAEPTPEFGAIVEESIYSAERVPPTFMFSRLHDDDPRAATSKNLASKYFEIQQKLQSHHLMGFDEARQFLSFSPLIIALALEQRMSASEISRILAARDPRYQMRWRPVKYVLDQVKASQAIKAGAIRPVYERHAAAEPELLSDLKLDEGPGYVARIAAALGCDADVETSLRTLLIDHVHEPYICILHYQLMILSFSDHAVTYAYEFSPRGQNVDFLTQRYNEAGIVVAQSAYLNNAKALLRFDQAWADGRSGHLRAANALASLLALLERMPVLPKAELARFILALLHRNLRISLEQNAGGLPEPLENLTNADTDQLLQAVAEQGSRTGGLIEQRLVDCYAMTQHGAQGAWRGVGDSVFAPNFFRKKLGDVEFMDPHSTPPAATGYESHGGNLTDLYVRDHFDTYQKVLAARVDQFEAIAPLPDWSFAVAFVAHSFGAGLPPQFPVTVGEIVIPVEVRYLTFAELADSMMADDARAATLNRLLVEQLNHFHVHRRVRARVAELAG